MSLFLLFAASVATLKICPICLGEILSQIMAGEEYLEKHVKNKCLVAMEMYSVSSSIGSGNVWLTLLCLLSRLLIGSFTTYFCNIFCILFISSGIPKNL